jgi:hypothetical protein
VELEHATVPGIGIDDQLAVGESLVEVVFKSAPVDAWTVVIALSLLRVPR